MASASEENWLRLMAAPPSITLHFYLPSGEFVYGHDVSPLSTLSSLVCMSVDQFHKYRLEGSIRPRDDCRNYLCFDNGFDDGRDYLYILVWNGMVLEGGRTFEDLVRDHGMSVDEPNDVLVVTK